MCWKKKTLDSSHIKLHEFNKQKQTFAKITHVHENHCLHRLKLSTELPSVKKTHSMGEKSILPAAIDMAGTMFGDRKIPLADKNVGRKISDISEDLCDQLTNQLKTSGSALKVDEATDAVKDAHLIIFGMCSKMLQRRTFCSENPLKYTAHLY
jgi:hypothetical protein